MQGLEEKLGAVLEIQSKLQKENKQKTKEVEEQQEANEALEKYCLKLTKELASRSRAWEEHTKFTNEYKAMEKNFEAKIQVLQQKLQAGHEMQSELEKENEQKSKEIANQQVDIADANEKVETAKIDTEKAASKN
eukprot:TRINITY_DN1786_c0_g1_i1.p1 TRINITY_DN1786_c0_g1~~TRINITY_DN1786_c0_g1_i1.p1  ORF type:complete len:135 (+),score=43.71 TRINITY_DN1786_c0_g1_i1:97-501(+)